VPVNRYRCTACGNLTRFDVTSSQRSRAFHHYSVGGELTIEEQVILEESVDEVSCRWCGHGRAVESLPPEAATEPPSEPTGAEAAQQTPVP
jgi:hypothetical protein